MTVREPYTDAEWALLMDAPWYASMALIALHRSKLLFGAEKELDALAESLIAGQQDFQENELIQATVAHLKQGETSQQRPGEPRPTAEMPAPDEEALRKLEQVAAVLDSKAPPDESRGFKQFILFVCEQVAGASGEGLPGFGKKVSDREAHYLDRIKDALRL